MTDSAPTLANARRSLLFVPGARPDRYEKAAASGADMVCIDLEDAVAPDGKDAAREAALAYLQTPPQGGVEVGLRINSIRHADGLADVLGLVRSGATPAFVMVPKAANAAELRVVREAIGPAAPPLFPLVESAEAMANAEGIAGAEGVAYVLFGGVDYSADVGCDLSWDALLYARARLAAACAKAGVVLFDVPYLDVGDEDGLIETTRKAKALGVQARAAIHPAQVSGIHRALAPSAEEIETAGRIVEAFEAAGGGVALLDGKLIELPVIMAARRTLALAERA
ncbi:MAG: CoA ester lyase [Pseudomonadota bacterium]